MDNSHSTQSLISAPSKWSWSYGVNEDAGPGSHNIPNTIGSQSYRYRNSPLPTIPKAEKGSKVYYSRSLSKEFYGAHSPPLNAYSPNVSLTEKGEVSVKFGSGKQRDLQFIDSYRDRSPGPIYRYKTSINQDTHIGSSFSRAPRDITPSATPAPNAYSPILRSHDSYATIKGTYSPDKVYARNYERYLKGRISPGPKYNVSDTKILKNTYMSKVGREAYEIKRELPGPGTYFAEPDLHNKSKSVSFGTGTRSVDVRNYGRSDEMYRF
ncbi:unnamed protein product [Blepharisma stoltei]|uniref:Uncharacterized protein n=1 Tax=Blepharisma stoltei TaxID=1481888 RepID=A0AAU9IPW5_9CILI|nr:unnamed protein product [Blepharisma stoltei]